MTSEPIERSTAQLEHEKRLEMADDILRVALEMQKAIDAVRATRLQLMSLLPPREESSG